jgi:hypothetical protein
LSDVRVDALDVRRPPETRPDFDIPSQRLVRICLKLASKLITNFRSKSRDIVWRQRTLADPQVRPTFLDFRQLQYMKPFCLTRVARPQTEALFTLPD